ncbi:MAG: hypothetical protein MAG431_00798 [Chloroflexi bacterium]|nr:hypothetical protein [Chloroflexota bacterium]
MAQVTIYLDTDTKEKMKTHVIANKISQSQWVSDLIRERLQSEWPDHVAALSGAWEDFPSLEEIRNTSAIDADRESL